MIGGNPEPSPRPRTGRRRYALSPSGRLLSRTQALDRRAVDWMAPMVLFVLAGFAFSLFGLDAELSRDESIYSYGGQQLAAGIPPYVSIVDPKTPLATMIAGAGVWTGRAAGIDDVVAIRIAFFLVSCLSVVAVFHVGTTLLGSTWAGALAAITLIALSGFAMDALGGPNAKTPAVGLAALATVLPVRRHWFWGGVAASLAALVWQPLGMYVPSVIVAAWLMSERHDRVRAALLAVSGAALPAAIVVGYFLVSGALAEFVESALLLPLTGAVRMHEYTVPERIAFIVELVQAGFGGTAVLFWLGLCGIGLLIGQRLWWGRPRDTWERDPVLVLVLPPLIFLVLFSLIDFQGYDDAFPFLLYSSLGLAALLQLGAARLEARSAALAVMVAPVVATLLMVISLATYARSMPEGRALVHQRHLAARVNRLLGPDGTLYALGDPSLLVLTGRTNPSRYIYLSSGVDRWLVDRTPGGYSGWLRRIVASDPDVVYLAGWLTRERFRDDLRAWLRRRYERVSIPSTMLFATPEALGRDVR